MDAHTGGGLRVFFEKILTEEIRINVRPYPYGCASRTLRDEHTHGRASQMSGNSFGGLWCKFRPSISSSPNSGPMGVESPEISDLLQPSRIEPRIFLLWD